MLQERAAQQQKRAVEVAKLRTEREAQLEEQVGGKLGGRLKWAEHASGVATGCGSTLKTSVRVAWTCISSKVGTMYNAGQPAYTYRCPALPQANRKAVAAELKKRAEEEMSARITLDLKRQMEVGRVGQCWRRGRLMSVWWWNWNEHVAGSLGWPLPHGTKGWKAH